MSREDVKAEEMVEQLRERFVETILDAQVGLPAVQALQLADGLCTAWIEALAGLRVTHRATVPVDGAAIRRDWQDGMSLLEIMKAHKCSRSTAYSHHPSRARRAATRA